MELPLDQAYQRVLKELTDIPAPAAETVPLAAAAGRVLAASACADRDFPPFDRAMRDGYAVRAADIRPGVTLPCMGQVRAGQAAPMAVSPGTCIEIMTGAPVPGDADAVLMVEFTRREGDRVTFERDIAAGANIAAAGSDAAAGREVLAAGSRLDYAAIGLLAAIGCVAPPVYRRPRVAILGTGDELVEAHQSPSPVQIRNSNTWALAAQVERAGGIPVRLPIAPDAAEALGALIDQALDPAREAADLLVLSGGVSMGRYDLVEPVLAARGAEFFFDAVQIRPGRPVVFGRLRDRWFFGLPGNPVSSQVTFELFARPAIERLSGVPETRIIRPLLRAELDFDWTGKALPLTVFLPIRLRGALVTGRVERLNFQGSADQATLAAADGFLVIPPFCSELKRGSQVEVLLK